MPKINIKYGLLLTRTIVVIVILIWIWAPEFLMWHVNLKTPTAEIINESRSLPSTSTLIELGQMDLKPPSNPLDDSQVIRLADKALNGILSIPGFDDITVSPIFDASDLSQGSAKQQLLFASLITVDYLLEAYHITHQDKFYVAAMKSIQAFCNFESSRFLDIGFLWNDHAIAARIPILIKFWSYYRDRDDFESTLAQQLFKLIIRSGLLLAKPEHYSWRTGHGIIQNIGLLQISAAFPFLQESEHFRNVAIQRFSEHLPYYVNQEGVTLLHSAEYNYGGVRLFSMVMRLYTLSELPIPEDWWGRYHKVVNFYDTLQRPDRTLPMIGDTRSIADWFGPPKTFPLEDSAAGPLRRENNKSDYAGLSLYPGSGYAIWWYPTDQSVNPLSKSQLVTTWSYFPGLGHKLADELSILIWANERNWITNVGYWPYGHPLRLKAESWDGSNAPHLIDENKSSIRTARSTKFAVNDEIFYIKMIRNGPENFMVQREVIQIEKNIWIVLDKFDNSIPRNTRTNWTFFPDLILRKGDEINSFVATDVQKNKSMISVIKTSSNNEASILSGNVDPFAGWVVIDETPMPANTITVHSSTEDDWQLAVFILDDSTRYPNIVIPTVSFFNLTHDDQWEATITNYRDINFSLSRTKEQIHLVTKDKLNHSESILNFIDIPYPKDEISAINQLVQSAYEKSTRRVPLISYRVKISYLLLALFVLQEFCLLVVRKYFIAITYYRVQLAILIFWLGAGAGLTEYYLVAGK
ncbi:MAG: hypothetical protein E6Q61_02215 [Nitrosomonas sp.]|nr:MAG: hypothetical protein E6Q61_02215 [Nitrosomonas sp.]